MTGFEEYSSIVASGAISLPKTLASADLTHIICVSHTQNIKSECLINDAHTDCTYDR